MPRRARMYLPGFPYHVVQRGNNREACFFEPENYQYYLELLAEVMPRYGVSLHAYVLMTNHIHLLMTPNQKDSISQVMKVVGSRYAGYVNRKYKRTGSLWEGRHKASVVDTENYLLKCYRYIELNPVAANMVQMPKDYRWSSYQANGQGDDVEWVTPHEEYVRLGLNRKERCQRYRNLFDVILSRKDEDAIQKAMHYCQPLGDDHFRKQIERKLGYSVGYAGRGRPKSRDATG